MICTRAPGQVARAQTRTPHASGSSREGSSRSRLISNSMSFSHSLRETNKWGSRGALRNVMRKKGGVCGRSWTNEREEMCLHEGVQQRMRLECPTHVSLLTQKATGRAGCVQGLPRPQGERRELVVLVRSCLSGRASCQ